MLDAAASIIGVQLGDTASSPRLDGHLVTLAVGSSTCTGATDEHGLATCRLPNPPPGPQTVPATLAGDRAAAGEVTFWSPSRWLVNTLTGGQAPASFKGFVHPIGNWWTASPGFGQVPTTVPAWLGVVVTSAVTKDAAEIKGNKTGLVVVHVDTYDPALVGRGTVVYDAG